MEEQGERVAFSAGKRLRPIKPKHLEGCHESLRHAKQDGVLHEKGRFAERRLQAGELLHNRWFELFVVLLVVMELVMIVIEAAIDHNYICINAADIDVPHFQCESKTGPRASVLLQHFDGIGKNIVIFFFLEMFIKIFIGQIYFFQNHWQVLDLLVVGINYTVAFDLSSLIDKNAHETYKEYAGLLMFIRCWRLVVIVNLFREEQEINEYLENGDHNALLRSEAHSLCNQYGGAVHEGLVAPSSAEAGSVFRFLVAPWPSKECFDSIATYRYNVFETPTPLVRFVSTTCDAIVLRLPDWLSPNVISVAGVVPLIINAAVLCLTCEMDGPAPAWLLITSALTFAWQELCDNCDGKQARRLGCGSPLGSMVDHTFDSIVSLPVIWIMNIVLQYPPQVVLMTQAGAVVYAIVLPWSERYKGYFPIYFVADYVAFAMTAWIVGAMMGPAELSKQLAYSPIDVNIVSLRAGLFGLPVAMIISFHIFSTLWIAKKEGKLALAVGQVLPPALVIPATMLWKADIATDYFRYISVVLGALVVVYHLKEIVKTMAHPHYVEGYLLDKPMMMAYIVIASMSRLVPSGVLSRMIPLYAVLSAVVAAAYVCAVFNSVATRLGIARMFLVPASCRDVPTVANES